jgi:tetratricopeptide (TPR) repeat protein
MRAIYRTFRLDTSVMSYKNGSYSEHRSKCCSSISREQKTERICDMINFWCNTCGKTINANDKDAGKKCKCPGCGKLVAIPIPKSVTPVTKTEPAPTLAPKRPKPHTKSQPTTPTIAEAMPMQAIGSEAKTPLHPSATTTTQQKSGIGKPELIGIGVGVIAVVLVIGFILQQFLWKDTWEIDNQDAIMRIRDEALSSFESKGYESALAKNNELLALIGDRKLGHSDLIKAVSETKAVAEKIIKTRQALSEQMLSKLGTQAKASADKGDMAKALKIYDEALSFARTVKSKSPAFIAIASKITKARNAISERIAQEQEAQTLLTQAEDHVKKRRHADAIIDCKKAIAINPDSAKAYCTLGIACNSLKKYTDAIAAYEKCTKLKPDYAEAYFGMGFAYNILKQYPEAVTAYKKAIDIKPDYAKAYLLMGIPYKNLGQYSKAIAACKKCLALQPTGDLADDARNFIRLLSKEKNKTAVVLKREDAEKKRRSTPEAQAFLEAAQSFAMRANGIRHQYYSVNVLGAGLDYAKFSSSVRHLRIAYNQTGKAPNAMCNQVAIWMDAYMGKAQNTMKSWQMTLEGNVRMDAEMRRSGLHPTQMLPKLFSIQEKLGIAISELEKKIR